VNTTFNIQCWYSVFHIIMFNKRKSNKRAKSSLDHLFFFFFFFLILLVYTKLRFNRNFNNHEVFKPNVSFQKIYSHFILENSFILYILSSSPLFMNSILIHSIDEFISRILDERSIIGIVY
jgi:hypothetical protein